MAQPAASLADNLCIAFETLKTDVTSALTTQIGDSRLIVFQRRRCEQFIEHVGNAWVHTTIYGKPHLTSHLSGNAGHKCGNISSDADKHCHNA